jgi:hypothetical protein
MQHSHERMAWNVITKQLELHDIQWCSDCYKAWEEINDLF